MHECFEGAMKPLIITAAITGAETTKEMNPALPATPEEQAKASKECVEAGASIIHLHVRDEKAKASQDLNRFKESILAIRETCDPVPIIQISTGGAVGVPMSERMRPIVELKPEMASLNVGSMNFGNDVFLNPLPEVRELVKALNENNVIPEVEVYDVGHIDLVKRLLKEGLLSHPIHYQFVLGVVGGMSGEERNIKFMIDSIDKEDSWAVAGIGRFELPLAKFAAENGGFVRVGFEDNVYIEKGVLAKSNAELVLKVVKFAKAVNRPIASIEETRNILGIK